MELTDKIFMELNDFGSFRINVMRHALLRVYLRLYGCVVANTSQSHRLQVHEHAFISTLTASFFRGGSCRCSSNLQFYEESGHHASGQPSQITKSTSNK